MLDILKDFGVAFLSAFLQIVLPALATILAAWVIGWVKSKLNSNNLQIVKDIVKAAVMAAEQENLVGRIEEKKEYAFAMATNWLESKGIKFNLVALDSLIEAAVYEEFNKWRDQDDYDEPKEVAGTD